MSDEFISVGSYITLPTSGVPPTANIQLGGTTLYHASNALINPSTYTTIFETIELPVGTYLFTGSASFIPTSSGVSSIITCSLSSSATTFPIAESQLAVSLNQSTIASTYNTGSRNSLGSVCLLTVSTPAKYYFVAYYNRPTGSSLAFTVGGQGQITRIA